MVGFESVATGVPDRLWIAAAVLLLGIVVGYLVGTFNKRLLRSAGVPGAIEGTAFERTARNVGTSTVSILGWLSGLFVVLVSFLVALNTAEVNYTGPFWSRVANFVPQLFIALFVLVVGLVVGDKAELVAGERLKGVKLPESTVVPGVVKWSVFYIAALVALSQVGVATTALLLLLAAYAAALIVFLALALRQLLPAGAAGIYLLFNQPYSIGDRVELGGKEGVVQEVSVFTTTIEDEEAEHVVPNHRAMEEGITRLRQ
jgi:small-conductance mechanosensitive channel